MSSSASGSSSEAGLGRPAEALGEPAVLLRGLRHQEHLPHGVASLQQRLAPVEKPVDLVPDRLLFRSRDLNLGQAMKRIESSGEVDPSVQTLIRFIRDSERGIIT